MHELKRYAQRLLLLTLPFNFLAALDFETERIELEVGWGDEAVEASYPFTNRSEQAVTILQVRTSCGCTAATPEKNRYEPGESGAIDARFVVGNRQGVQRNRIRVQTDQDASHQLDMIVDVPIAWELRNRVLVWRDNERLEAKEARLVVHDPAIDKVELVHQENSFWDVELRPSDEEGIWNLVAEPKSFEVQRREALTIHMKRTDGSRIRANLFLRML